MSARRSTCTARARWAASVLAGALTLGGCASTTSQPVGHSAPPTVTLVTTPARAGDILPPQFQYLYGSAEAAALSEQAYNGLTSYVMGLTLMLRHPGTGDRTADGQLKRVWTQAILAPGSSAERPLPLACREDQPFAIVVDVDETALLNLGYEYRDAFGGGGFDPKRWEAWERTGAAAVAAVPGAARAFAQLRRLGVAVVANSNRSAANAAATEQALAKAGLGAFRHGETLFLKGDVDGKSAKDGRRAAIAARYCVLAMAGDQLGDFADFFNAPGPAPAPGRRALASAPGIAARWGTAWFLLPNPVYGTGLGSGWTDTFPLDRRWTDPGAAGAVP